jgi:hypothetical protein
MANNNLSFIIDYLYQKNIEDNDDYIECVYDIELLSRRHYMMDDNIISRFILPNGYLKYKHIPYDLSSSVIRKLSKVIEITSNDFVDCSISESLISINLDSPSILYYDQKKLLLNNNFEFDYDDRLDDNQTTTLDILIEIRRYYDKRN